jgi:magnesium-transporting ATPase (P-type)
MAVNRNPGIIESSQEADAQDLGRAERRSRVWSCYNLRVMKVIRYGFHFATLTVAAVAFWLAKDLYLPNWISNFDFFHYALMGALHAACVVMSLRVRRVTHPIFAFPISALVFVLLATVLSAVTPILGLWGQSCGRP